MRQCLRLIGLAAILLLAGPGCGQESKFHQVDGTVTWNGAAVADGEIIFIPEEKEFGADASKIKDGKYSLKAREGKKRVEIRATRPVPGKLGPMGEPAIEDFIPEEYNDKSTLSADISKDKKNFDFPLTDKK